MDFLVTADDRTGAFETAAALADRGAGPVDVIAWPDPLRFEGVVVYDVGTRHLSPESARDRLELVPIVDRRGHKIDSTLRGNWPEELAAIAEHRPVLLVPALPDLGRTCVGGVVLDHGRPVHEGHAGSDVRRRITTSRPAESLRGAGVVQVSELSDLAAVRDWLADGNGVGVADASDGTIIDELVGAWRGTDVVLAGTSAVLGAAAGHDARHDGGPFARVSPPVLVVCGSVHPVTRRQIAFAERQGILVTALVDDIVARHLRGSDALILASEIPVGDVDEPLAVAAASTLARGVDELCRVARIGALIVIGGDTAAAVFSSASVRVFGSVAPGTAWAEVDGLDMPVITRSGGFGGDGALVDLIRATLQP